MEKTIFEQRTGCSVDSKYFDEVILPDLEASEDKSLFCKSWVSNGGFQEAYDALLENRDMLITERELLKNEQKSLQDKCRDLEAETEYFASEACKYKNMLDETISEIKSIAHFIIEQSYYWDSEDMMKKASDMLGEKDYIKYKLSNDMELSKYDKELLSKIL